MCARCGRLSTETPDRPHKKEGKRFTTPTATSTRPRCATRARAPEGPDERRPGGHRGRRRPPGRAPARYRPRGALTVWPSEPPPDKLYRPGSVPSTRLFSRRHRNAGRRKIHTRQRGSRSPHRRPFRTVADGLASGGAGVRQMRPSGPKHSPRAAQDRHSRRLHGGGRASDRAQQAKPSAVGNKQTRPWGGTAVAPLTTPSNPAERAESRPRLAFSHTGFSPTPGARDTAAVLITPHGRAKYLA